MFNKQYNNIIDKLCVRLLHIKKKNRKVFIVLSGAQGSGKTTLTRNLKYKLAKNYKVLSLSIDDFYLSKRDREILSSSSSQLFKTRGVPGTHNIKNLEKVLKIFKSGKSRAFSIPIFSKAKDDIEKRRKNLLKFPYDFFLLEGWCNGYRGEINKNLNKPINLLEKRFDKSRIWRKNVNIFSKIYYLKIYKKADFSIFLKVPSFNKVFYWRKKQEMQIPKKYRMSPRKIKEFVCFYERITKNLLFNFKKYFDCYITIDKFHNYKSLTYKNAKKS